MQYTTLSTQTTQKTPDLNVVSGVWNFIFLLFIFSILYGRHVSHLSLRAACGPFPDVPLQLPQLGTVKVHGTQCLGPACTACMCNLISPYSVVFFSLFLLSLMLFSSPLFILYPLTLPLPPATDLIPTFTVPSPSLLTPKGRWQRSQISIFVIANKTLLSP